MSSLGAASSSAAPTVTRTRNSEDARLCRYTTTLMALLHEQSPAHALWSLLAMCWFWSSGCEAEEKELFLGSGLLSLGQILKDKLACLAEDMTACLPCHRDTKGDKQPVIMGRFAVCLLVCFNWENWYYKDSHLSCECSCDPQIPVKISSQMWNYVMVRECISFLSALVK